MAEVIRKHSGEMESAAQGIDKLAEEVLDLRARLKSTVDNLRATWEGAASTSYDEEVLNYLPTFNDCAAALNGLAGQVRSVNNNFTQVDESMAAQIRG